MESLQQTVFHNLSKNTQYYFSSKKISQKHENFPKYREQEIANQFELVDLHNKGKLTKKQIISYLNDKYQWLNTSVVNQVFKTMDWDEDEAVTKEEFVRKYLAKQRHLYNQIYGLKYYQNWVRVLQEIYANQIGMKRPRIYFYTQIRNIELYQNSKAIEWMDLVVEYENHESKTHYQIEEASHSASYPSFQIWLPANGEEFFLRFRFLDLENHQNVYGQTYLSIPLDNKISKMANLDLDIMKNGQKVGHCLVCVCAQPNIDKVKKQLAEIRQKQRLYEDVAEDKVKQYEYLHFLWGIRHRSPHKISPLDTKWMLVIRMIILLAIGIIGVIVHIFGRCQPLSIIIMFLILRSWEYVFLRHQKFLLVWITVAAILLDIIWIALCSSYDSQINFISLSEATILSYILLGVKVILLAYLLIAEQSLVSE